MTMSEIFHGRSDYFPGLIPLVYAYLEYIRCPQDTFEKLDKYLQYISRKAKGEIITTASWMRGFVSKHPAYKGDSVVSEEIAYELLIACQEIGEGSRRCEEILGRDVVISQIDRRDAYGSFLKGKLDAVERTELINKMIQRALERQHQAVVAAAISSASEEADFQSRSTSRELPRGSLLIPFSSSSNAFANGKFSLHSSSTDIYYSGGAALKRSKSLDTA
jgi:hypothetical protein